MKKTFLMAAALTAGLLGLAGCGGKHTDPNRITVAASNVPHAEILEQAKPLLAEQGFDLRIQVMQDYIMPNLALANHEIDANYFQHLPYMDTVVQEHKNDPNYDFVSAGAIHIEPIGIYSKKYKHLQDLPDNGLILMRDAVSDEGRVLAIFQREGLIKLKPGLSMVDTRVTDIIDNPKHLRFQPNIEASMLPQMYNNNEGDAVVINANYALGAGLDPVHDPIALESGENNPYVNIVTVHRTDLNSPKIEALVKALHSPQVQDFIRSKYKGAVVPVN